MLLTVELFAYFISLDKSVPSSVGASSLNELARKNRTLRRGIAGLSPKEIYILIDTANEVLSLKKGNRTILKALISSGNGNILRTPGGERQWVFDTPRGEFEVKKKIAGPKWIRPDWAFIEEEEDIPKTSACDPSILWRISSHPIPK